MISLIDILSEIDRKVAAKWAQSHVDDSLLTSKHKKWIEDLASNEGVNKNRIPTNFEDGMILIADTTEVDDVTLYAYLGIRTGDKGGRDTIFKPHVLCFFGYANIDNNNETMTDYFGDDIGKTVFLNSGMMSYTRQLYAWVKKELIEGLRGNNYFKNWGSLVSALDDLYQKRDELSPENTGEKPFF